MHQNLLPNNNDAQSTTKYGFLLRPGAQIVALRAHCTRTALKAPLEDRIYNVIAFYAGTLLDRGPEERTYGTLGHGVCNRGRKDIVE